MLLFLTDVIVPLPLATIEKKKVAILIPAPAMLPLTFQQLPHPKLDHLNLPMRRSNHQFCCDYHYLQKARRNLRGK